jgi:hypothetical protein
MRSRLSLGRRFFESRAAAEAGGSAQTAIRRLHRVLVVVLVCYCATTLPGVRSSGGYNVLIDGWLQNGVLVAASLVIYLRVLSVSTDGSPGR